MQPGKRLPPFSVTESWEVHFQMVVAQAVTAAAVAAVLFAVRALVAARRIARLERTLTLTRRKAELARLGSEQANW